MASGRADGRIGGSSRRSFLAAAGSAGVLLAVGARGAPGHGLQQSLSFALALDGQIVGTLEGVSGGAPVIQMAGDPGGARQFAGVLYEPISMSIGPAMQPAVYTWLRDSAKGQGSRKSGSIVGVDFNRRERSRLDFIDAVVSEVKLPAIDAAVAEALGAVQVTLAPAQTKRVAASGAVVNTPDSGQGRKKDNRAFRVSIDGLDRQTTDKIVRVAALSVRIHGQSEDFKGKRASQGVEIGDLVVTLPDAAAMEFHRWMDEVLNRGTFAPHSGRIDLLDALNGTVQSSIVLQDLDLVSVGYSAMEADRILRCKAVMKPQSIDLMLA